MRRREAVSYDILDSKLHTVTMLKEVGCEEADMIPVIGGVNVCERDKEVSILQWQGLSWPFVKVVTFAVDK
jgi:hypothetical protein